MASNQSTPTEESPDMEPNTNPNASAEDAALADLASEDLSAEGTASKTSGQNVNLGAALSEAEARVLRAQAELENFRKRMRRERDEDRKYAALSLIRDLLPVIDNLERAIEAADGGEKSGGLAEGVKIVVSQLKTMLQQHQCFEIEALGQAFDPMSHEAIAQFPSAEHEAGLVMEVSQTGYRLHDRIVRPAQVVVSQGPAEKS